MPEPYQPRHRADDRDERRSYTEAKCSGIDRPFAGHSTICPRHEPTDYADMMARHATDSIR